jgi:hypothetical protein
MSSKSTTSRIGSFFGIGNKQSTKRAAAQKEHVDAQQHTPPSDHRALHDAPYPSIILRDAGGRRFSPREARTDAQSRQSDLQDKHYPQSLYSPSDPDPFAATSPIALPTSPNARSLSHYNTLQPPPKSRPLLIQTRSDPSVPVPSPFGSPIDHDRSASG